MKKYVLIIFLLAGLSSAIYAQLFKKRDKFQGAERITKVKPRKQISHFEKQKRDEKKAQNGSNYKKARKFKVDGNGFKSYQALRKERRLIQANSNKKKKYDKRLARTVYARE